MKKILTLASLVSVLFSNAQDSTRKKSGGYDPENLFVGGSISLSLGGYQNGFLIGLNPYIGYKFLSFMDAGVVINYQHYSEKDFYDNKYRSNTFGGGVFTRIY